MKKGKTFKIVAPVVTAILLAFAIVATVVLSDPLINYAYKEYLIQYDSTTDVGEALTVAAEGDELAERIELEGMVLAKNADNVLPLSYDAVKAKGVNVLGWSSQSWVIAGAGSGRSKQNREALTIGGVQPSWSNHNATNNRREDSVKGNIPNMYYAEVDIYGALSKYSIPYNTNLRDFYRGYGQTLDPKLPAGERPYFTNSNNGTLSTYDFQFSRLVEPAMTAAGYDTLLTSAKTYSDTAFVVISRVSGESNDSPKVQYKGSFSSNTKPAADDPNRHYLEISTEEEALLKYAGANFAKTIVLINSTNTMELGFMDTIPGLDACVIVGATGPRVASAIPKVLFDKVTYQKDNPEWKTGDPAENRVITVTENGITPSGRMSATYAYDLSTAPSWTNSGYLDAGQRLYTGNVSGLYPYEYSPNSGTSGTSGNITNGNFLDNPRYAGLAYTDYQEGIYVGYKWYETADAEGYWTGKTSSKAGSGKTGYDAVVQYPFGHGLSYTDFEWRVTKNTIVRNGSEVAGTSLQQGDKIKFEVRVTNTGVKPGKEVVQAYFTPPYTKGGIEKASMNLAAIAKTQTLAPGANEIVSLEFNVYDMASYDCYDKNGNGFKGYEIEGGTYEIKLMDNSHEVGKFPFGVGASYNFTVPTGGYKCETDPVTGKPVANRFTGANPIDGVPVDGSEESAPVTYISRADFTGTFPSALKAARAITEKVKTVNIYTKAMADAWSAANNSAAAKITPGNGTGDLKLATIPSFNPNASNNNNVNASAYNMDLITALGKDYNSPLWDQLLGQMTITEMRAMCIQNGTNTQPTASIGMPASRTLDGPSQYGGWSGSNQGTGFPNPVTLAQTFNTTLAYQMGLQVANDAIARGNHDGAWLAPGVNIHRSPLGGRNYEYYSEDSFLSGTMAVRAVIGCENKGIPVYVKHLALYDQESSRDSLYTWVTEQALREIYLKPFKMLIQEGSANGIMTAYNRVGAIWGGGSEALLRKVIREEMGFKGSILTDWVDRPSYMMASHALRAGGDLTMAGWTGGKGWYTEWDTEEYMLSSPAVVAELREANKRTVYAWVEAKYTASIYDAEKDPYNTITPIQGGEMVLRFDWIAYIIIPLLYVLAIGGGGALCFFAYKKEILGLFGKKSKADN